jgi:hypothetical protein
MRPNLTKLYREICVFSIFSYKLLHEFLLVDGPT